ncbi:serine protease, partial [Streptomyces sp. NPDC058953]
MTPEPQSSISGRSATGRRRAARIAAAASLVTALVAAGTVPVFAAPADDPGATGSTGAKAVQPAEKKLGAADVELLAEAEAKGEKQITVMIATAPGATEPVVAQLGAVDGAYVGKTYDQLGYVRATLPTRHAESALRTAAKLPSVHGIDLRHEVKLDDPTPGADTVKPAGGGGRPALARRPPAAPPTPPPHPHHTH